jgi:hypothetical protein
MSYGPALPPHLAKKRQDESEDEKSENDADEDDSYGPSLPPGFKKTHTSTKDDKTSFVGPSVDPPPGEPESSEDDDEDLIGPLPPAPGTESASSVAADLESRARRMRDRLEGKDQGDAAPARETWMLELPPEKVKCFGLGPRMFRKNEKPQTSKAARAQWTETPEQRARRERGEVETEEKADSERDASNDKDVLEYLAGLQRDQEMEAIATNLRAKRGSESLLDQHSKKLKKQRAEASAAGASAERRPFDRDIDLQANKFDNAQKERMIKKAAQLDSRFSSGGNKYL